MASRRNAFAAASSSIGDIIGMMMRAKIQEESQARQNADLIGRQQRLAEMNHSNELDSIMSQHPEVAQRRAGFDPRAKQYFNTPGQMATPMLEDVSKATAPNMVPEDEVFKQRWGASGGAPDAPELQGLLQAVAARRGGLQAGIDKTRDAAIMSEDHYDPQLHTQVRTMSGGQNIQQGPTPEEAGKDKLNTSLNDELSPAFAVAKAQVDNMTEAMTRANKVKTAGDVAGVAAGAAKRAQLAPDIVASEVGREHDMAQAQAEGTAAGGAGKIGQPTEAERIKASQMLPLVNAHAKAMELEKAGAAIQTGQETISQSPMLNGPLGKVYSEKNRAYMQAAMDFSANITYLRSGAAITPAEFSRFLSNMFVHPNEPDDVRQQKLRTRTAFIAASQIAMGRGKMEGGQSLGRAIQAGIMDPSVLESLQLDPEVEAGIDSILQPIVIKKE